MDERLSERKIVSTARGFYPISATLVTAGQPTEAELMRFARDGVGAVINLVPSDSRWFLPDEAEICADLGAEYRHIPVVWTHPTADDFELVCDALTRFSDRVVLLHCAANYRVSAFVFLWRVVKLGWSIADARPDLLALWTPDPTWTEFIRTRLRDSGLSLDTFASPD